MVHDLARVGYEEEREVDAGEDQDHKQYMAISPIMNDQWSGNTLLSAVRAKRRRTEALVEPAREPLALDASASSRFQKPGPTGSL